MSAINAAWELIGDPAARAAFDRSRAAKPDTRHGGDQTPASAAKSGPDPGHPRPSSGSGRSDAPKTPPGGAAREPEIVSPDWTSGRSSQGGGYDESMHTAQGHGAAGPPPGRPSGTVLNFGRYAGWSLGEVARHDLEYIEWLDRAPIGRNYRQEIDEILRTSGRRKSATSEASDRHGLYRRR
jgi:curved DNA-binding protein CbpA